MYHKYGDGKNDDVVGCAFLVIFIIVEIIAFISLGPQEALKYLSK